MLTLLRKTRRPLIQHSVAITCCAVVICFAWSWRKSGQPIAAEESPRPIISAQPPVQLPVQLDELDENSAEAQPEEDPDEKYRRMALGTWEDNYHGKRTLTIYEDGSAKMLMEPEGFGATLFAKQLHFDIAWSIENGILSLKTLGGKPKSKIALISKIYGDEAAEEILELTADRFLVRHDEDTDFDWRRVETPVE